MRAVSTVKVVKHLFRTGRGDFEYDAQIITSAETRCSVKLTVPALCQSHIARIGSICTFEAVNRGYGLALRWTGGHHRSRQT